MNQPDHFSGIWVFDHAQSQLSTSAPLRWTQKIDVAGDNVRVREEIERVERPLSVVIVEARFDGERYPISGSPVADTIAYTRDGNTITGVGRKNEMVSLRETIVVAPEERTLTFRYSIYLGDREVATGAAVFQRDET